MELTRVLTIIDKTVKSDDFANSDNFYSKTVKSDSFEDIRSFRLLHGFEEKWRFRGFPITFSEYA